MGSPFPNPGDHLDPGIKTMSPVSPALAVRFFTTEPLGKPHFQPIWRCETKRRKRMQPSEHSHPIKRSTHVQELCNARSDQGLRSHDRGILVSELSRGGAVKGPGRVSQVGRGIWEEGRTCAQASRGESIWSLWKIAPLGSCVAPRWSKDGIGPREVGFVPWYRSIYQILSDLTIFQTQSGGKEILNKESSFPWRGRQIGYPFLLGVICQARKYLSCWAGACSASQVGFSYSCPFPQSHCLPGSCYYWLGHQVS